MAKKEKKVSKKLPTEFYSVVTKKKIKIPISKITTVTKNGRLFAVGTYTAKGKEYKAWRVMGMADKIKVCK